MASVADTNPSAQTRGIGERDLRTKMKAACYEKQGAARDVLIIGEMAIRSPAQAKFEFALLSQASIRAM